MNGFNFSNNVVRCNDGSVDVDATVQGFQSELESWILNNESNTSAIEMAVDELFDLHRGKRLSIDSIVHNVLVSMKVGLSNQAEVTAMVETYIRDNTDRYLKRDRKTGEVVQEAEPARTRKFGMLRGPGGGTFRWSDATSK